MIKRLSKIGGEGVNLNLGNVFKYIICLFFDGTPYSFLTVNSCFITHYQIIFPQNLSLDIFFSDLYCSLIIIVKRNFSILSSNLFDPSPINKQKLLSSITHY